MKKVLFVLLAFGISGCKKDNPPVDKRSAAIVTQKVDASALLKGYEVVRVALAADDMKATQAGGAALAKMASTQTNAAKGEEQKTLQRLTQTAQKVATSKDFDAARLAFGEMSKQTLLLIATDTGRKQGVTAYQCPMAKGYKKWIQLDQEMANPYMGKSMLKCGGKDTLAP